MSEVEQEKDFDLKTVCAELGTLQTQYFKIGVQLGIPDHKLKQFREGDDPLSAVIAWWQKNSKDASWMSLVRALKCDHIGETGIAENIERKYCQKEDNEDKNAGNDEGEDNSASKNSMTRDSPILESEPPQSLSKIPSTDRTTFRLREYSGTTDATALEEEPSLLHNQEKGYNDDTSAPVFAVSTSSSFASLEVTSRLLKEISQLQLKLQRLEREMAQELEKRDKILLQQNEEIKQKEEKLKELDSQKIMLESEQPTPSEEHLRRLQEMKATIEKRQEEIERDRKEHVRLERSKEYMEKITKLSSGGATNVEKKVNVLEKQHKEIKLRAEENDATYFNKSKEIESEARSLFLKTVAEQEVQIEMKDRVSEIMESEDIADELPTEDIAREKEKRIIGRIMYYRDEVLGTGSMGTYVYRGEYTNDKGETRPVAVKQLLSKYYKSLRNEVEDQDMETVKNVVTYFGIEKDKMFHYIAFEFCDASFPEYIQGKLPFTASMVRSIDLLHQTMQGIAYLHSQDIVHKYLKPENIMIAFSDSGEAVAKIRNLGLKKKRSSKLLLGLRGAVGWTAPEMCEIWIKQVMPLEFEKSADIFSMGCVIYYMLTSGNHPFDPEHSRQANIIADKYCLDFISKDLNLYQAEDLIKKMIRHSSSDRPFAEDVVKHCLFWTPEQHLSHLLKKCDEVDEKEEIAKYLDREGSLICRQNWKEHISSVLTRDIDQRDPPYDGTSLCDLLRFIREKKEKYSELSSDEKEELGSDDELDAKKFMKYFTRRFPRLLYTPCI